MTDAVVLDLVALLRRPPPAQRARFEVVDQLVSAFWHERPGTHGHGEEELLDVEARLGRTLPGSLRSAYARWGRSSFATQDPFVPLAQLEDRDGYLVFRREQQGCVAWGVRTDDGDDDPLVHLLEDPSNRQWRPDLGVVSQFLVHAAASEAIFAPAYDANAALDDDRGALEAVEAHFAELSVPPFLWWPDPDGAPARFFGGPDVLIVDHARTWLWVAALTPEALLGVRHVVPAAWQ